jgi:hypothetical protein
VRNGINQIFSLIDETLSGSEQNSLHVDPGRVYSMVGTNGDDLRGVPGEPSAHSDAVNLSTITGYTDAQSVMRVPAVSKEMIGSAKARFSLS